MPEPPTESFALAVRQAAFVDAEAALTILIKAAHALQARGIAQWTDEQALERDVTVDIFHHKTYLAFLLPDHRRPVATISLRREPSEAWLPFVQPGEPDSYYIHRFAVDPAHAGQGIGRELLDWTAAESVKNHGDILLRLDCWAGNTRLRRYYAEAGYKYLGEGLEGDWKVAFFERRLLPLWE